jgi:predicted nuclease of predicted toxin-antitoxin system
MLIKLDENLGERGRRMLEDAGHEVMTVGDQGLAGAADPHVIDVCRTERRCLVTLDLDFLPKNDPTDSERGSASRADPTKE